MTVVELLAEAQRMTRESFVGKYAHPWLLIENVAMAGAADARFETFSPGMLQPRTIGGKRLPPLPDHRGIRTNPDRYIVHPLVKSSKNPWADRILVGRAKNNDVVLPDVSVSKIHAYFTQTGAGAGAGYQLVACETMNPTTLNGTALAPNAAGASVGDGAVLQFASTTAFFIRSGELFSLLTGLP